MMSCAGTPLRPADPAPRKITLAEWHDLFRTLPDSLLDEFRYYRFHGRTPWNAYLQPPSFFNVYGTRVLKRLRFDNSLAALRLWGFVLNEGERLYRAKQAGMKVVAMMGDYGALAPLVYSFPGLVPFYPDFHYWTPFFCESRVLFETADGEGIGENCCFVRAALGAFLRGAYFPEPDLVIAAAGAACDDLNAVAQRAESLGAPFLWTELPWRKPKRSWFGHADFDPGGDGRPFTREAHRVLMDEFRRISETLSRISGAPFDEARSAETFSRVERGRRAIRRIRELTFSGSPAPLPALELMQVEFAGPSFGGDLDECVDVLEHVQKTVEERHAAGVGFGDPGDARVAWATPPPDPVLFERLEALGARLAATEFLVDQSRAPLDPERPPLDALARSLLAGSLIGSSEQRAERLCEEAVRNGARGAVISGLFASSHCVSETRILRDELSRALNGPVLTFDVPAPGSGRGGLANPVENRLAAYVEALKGRSRRK